MNFIYRTLIILLFCIGCNQNPNTLFRLRTSSETNIFFQNTILENDTFNILTEEYIYNGGGVGIGDFNNDGLQDIFFSANDGGNGMYINQTKFQFKDISKEAGIQKYGTWCQGVSVVDINNDGWLDIYICVTMHKDSLKRSNLLFVNQGTHAENIPLFKEMAKEYGIDEKGFSTHSAFFDADNDNDLDLYVLNNTINDKVPSSYRKKITDGTALNNDQLYRNNGNNTFTKITKKAGILLEGYGLGIAIGDINNDGWNDIYVSNDYISNDILYINNKNGTFTNEIEKWIGHTSQFSMGNDMADVNNDGWLDIITLDMLPEDNFRKKTTIGRTSYTTYINNRQYGYQNQHVRNMLHLNNGVGIPFSEISMLAGIHQTDWSWSPLFADFDNDGKKDLLITNGFPKDITDKDFANYRAEMGRIANKRMLIDSIPVVKISNYAFQNKGDLTFTDVTKKWGLFLPSFSNGAAFADLDNDGDLDYIVNNINEEPFVYENTLFEKNKKPKSHFIQIQLKGNAQNIHSIGTKVTIKYNNKLQYSVQNPYRGYLSSVENKIHFGLDTQWIDTILVEWVDKKISLYTHIPADQTFFITYNQDSLSIKKEKNIHTWFHNMESTTKILYKHKEIDKIDYNLQRIIPHKFSQSGPGIAVGDLNGDNTEDLLIGGSSGYKMTFFIQQTNGTFLMDSIFEKEKQQEDEGLLIFDADNDNDNDIYAVSGSIEVAQSDFYTHRMFLNDGKGNFTKSNQSLPVMSGSCVRASDFDMDGDLDLFVGGRIIPGHFPLAPPSVLLINNKGIFTDSTIYICPDIQKIGMVTDAIWSDFDNDMLADLIVVGQFIAPTFFKNNGKTLVKISTNLDNYKAWWNSIMGADLDRDGDTDYILGNIGKNNIYGMSPEHPLTLHAKDFDKNGSTDPILACYFKENILSDEQKLFPIHFWDEINSQSPRFRKKFSYYKQYAKTTLQNLLSSEDTNNMLILKANYPSTCILERKENNTFVVKPLPNIAQISPTNGIIAEDINDDDQIDILLIGNNYGNEVFIGKYDASVGLTLIGNEATQSFTPINPAISGFIVPADAKSLVTLSYQNDILFIASQNQDSVKVFAKNKMESPRKKIEIYKDDAFALIFYENGKTQKKEFYYGSGYLSQHSRNLFLSKNVREVQIFNTKGKRRM